MPPAQNADARPAGTSIQSYSKRSRMLAMTHPISTFRRCRSRQEERLIVKVYLCTKLEPIQTAFKCKYTSPKHATTSIRQLSTVRVQKEAPWRSRRAHRHWVKSIQISSDLERGLPFRRFVLDYLYPIPS